MRYRGKDPERSLPIANFPDGYCVSHTQDDEGFWRLTCDCPQYLMPSPGEAMICNHIGNLLDKGADSGQVKSVGEVDILTYVSILDPHILVTVHRKPGIIAHVHLSDPDDVGFRYVTLCKYDKFTASDRYWQPEWTVGIINKSHGRQQIRLLLLEWLMDHVSGCSQVPCGAPQHRRGSAPHENVEKHLTEKGLPNLVVLADVFDMLVTGWCRACNEDDGVPRMDS